MKDSAWFDNLKLEMQALDDDLADKVKKSTWFYFKSQNVDGKNQSAAAENLFWQLSERKFQDLVNACREGEEQTKALRKDFSQFASTAYNTYCPNDTARQLNAWAENLPNFGKYLKNGKQQEAKA
jgi:CRISPR system Cascade subunit CasA